MKDKCTLKKEYIGNLNKKNKKTIKDETLKTIVNKISY